MRRQRPRCHAAPSSADQVPKISSPDDQQPRRPLPQLRQTDRASSSRTASSSRIAGTAETPDATLHAADRCCESAPTARPGHRLAGYAGCARRPDCASASRRSRQSGPELCARPTPEIDRIGPTAVIELPRQRPTCNPTRLKRCRDRALHWGGAGIYAWLLHARGRRHCQRRSPRARPGSGRCSPVGIFGVDVHAHDHRASRARSSAAFRPVETMRAGLSMHSMRASVVSEASVMRRASRRHYVPSATTS